MGEPGSPPRVFARVTDNWMELTVRFVVSVRTARAVKDDMTRRLLQRLEAEGIAVASTTSDVTVSLRKPAPSGP